MPMSDRDASGNRDAPVATAITLENQKGCLRAALFVGRLGLEPRLF